RPYNRVKTARPKITISSAVSQLSTNERFRVRSRRVGFERESPSEVGLTEPVGPAEPVGSFIGSLSVVAIHYPQSSVVVVRVIFIKLAVAVALAQGLCCCVWFAETGVRYRHAVGILADFVRVVALISLQSRSRPLWPVAWLVRAVSVFRG